MDYSRVADNKTSEDILAKETLQKALDKVPFDFRSALVLKEIEGLSYEEISQALKIRLGTVESRIFRARTMLKNLLRRKEII